MSKYRNRERELAALDREMRKPGTLASLPAPVPLHQMGKQAAMAAMAKHARQAVTGSETGQS
jgi:hypothetical protein